MKIWKIRGNDKRKTKWINVINYIYGHLLMFMGIYRFQDKIIIPIDNYDNKAKIIDVYKPK